ncbi:MAG: hypothetical protein U0Y10_02130 [Spirosomataceae bacterium]
MAGVYTVTILNGGCSATYTVSVVVNQATASASSNSPVCSGNSLNLSATGGGSSYSWLQMGLLPAYKPQAEAMPPQP